MADTNNRQSATDKNNHSNSRWQKVNDLFCNYSDRITQALLAAFTLGLLIFSGLQWATLEKTDFTLKAQQRAWIEPERIELLSGLHKGEALYFVLHYRNHGSEPATNVVIQFGQTADDIPSSPPYGWFKGDNTVCDITHPNPGGLVTWKDKAYKLEYASSDIKDAQKIWAGHKTMRIETCIGYKTVNEPHFSAACFYTYPDRDKPSSTWPLVPCMNHQFIR